MTVTETVTLPKAEYDALLDRLEDAEDALTIRQFRTTVRELGWEDATKDCLPAELVERKLKGEHPVRITVTVHSIDFHGAVGDDRSWAVSLASSFPDCLTT